MSDLREPLEREARRIHGAPDALGRIRARTQSRQRTHRLVSALVALTVAATGILVAVRTFTPTSEGGGARPAYQPPDEGRLPVWPSFGAGAGDVAAIDSIQQRVDEGHQPGYLSPEIVAQMFAMEVLEWERSGIEANVQGDDPVQVAISNPMLDGPLADVTTTLTMERWRGYDDGIYVITSTDTEILDLRSPTPGQDVRGAEELTFKGSLEGISQRLLDLYLTMSIEGASSIISRGERGTITAEPAARPSADGEFETTLAMPEAPPAPGISVFVRSRDLKIAVEAFRLGPAAPASPVPPERGPTPTSDDATPAPVQVEVADGTGDLHATSYLGVLLQDRGRGTHHGGYSIVATIDPTTGDVSGIDTTEVIDRTVISCVPGADDEAERLRRLFFPDAEIRGGASTKWGSGPSMKKRMDHGEPWSL